MVRRIYVEKKADYAVKARQLKSEMTGYLGIDSVDKVRIFVRYDVENVSDETYRVAVDTVFSEPPVDTVYDEKINDDKIKAMFAVEYLPGQFDQRADSAMQCVRLINENEEPVIQTATVYAFEGNITEDEIAKVKSLTINPVDSREAQADKPDTLVVKYDEPEDVMIIDGFKDMPDAELKKLYDSLALAMTYADFLHIQKYFKNEEKRDPSITEIRVLDTYWSDHCRHTTFSTELKNISFDDGDYKEPIMDSYNKYLDTFNEMYEGRDDKYVCLMDLACLATKKLKKDGKLDDLEESEEINACSIVVPVDVDGKDEEWLINFKNETHNHPTEIEPFGGAATCLGGAIRDPLSGRTYVYQAMRVTGAADPTVSVEDTLEGKLPQKKIVTGAASGYSSYGNQIGLATGYVKEVYHPGYVAKRMEIGAVMAAAPRRAVKRLSPKPGDVIILLGGRTGRDGCGGATGSSKAHTTESIDTCGAEVQKGNAPTERKLQRLFRREEVSELIKKCNDFGAGGVSVAIGELADGLQIDLDEVRKKYAGLDGTELAISESQERMACVIAPENVEKFLRYAAEENLEAYKVAVVTEDPRLVLSWRGKEIVNLSRAFLDTNGAHQETNVSTKVPAKKESFFKGSSIEKVNKAIADKNYKEALLAVLSDLNGCSQRGLVENFDGSIGAASTLMPFGGKYQLTQTQSMVAKVPMTKGNTKSVSMMSYGFDPYLSSWSPYHGAIYAVLESIARITATGGDYKKIRFSFQEYFGKMTEDPYRWGMPFSALLGAFDAQLGFGLASIGGKDSMSGTFNDIDVPPTLVSFAVDMAKVDDVITPEFKNAGSDLVLFKIDRDEYDKPDYEVAKKIYDAFIELNNKGYIASAYAINGTGVAGALSNMAFGNKIGFTIDKNTDLSSLFMPNIGDIVCEASKDDILDAASKLGIADHVTVIGKTNDLSKIEIGEESIDLEDAINTWESTLESVYPTTVGEDDVVVHEDAYDEKNVHVCKHKVAKPKVFIPVFPGTNCEYDSARAFIRAGADVETRVFKNLTAEDIRESVEEFAKVISQSQIIMFPGGFSAGDEPEGSAKFFAAAFRNDKIKDEVMKLLNERDGLALGICNGFQALIKLGLVPYGRIQTGKPDSPTLTYNTIGRHISKMVYTRVVSNKSPWLSLAKLDGVYVNPASHGEGRFVATPEWLEKLKFNGQIATQYVNPDGEIVMDDAWNVNGSYRAIEGITSPDGRVLGKMAHSERVGDGVAINIYGEQDMKIFEAGVRYFK